MMASLPGAAPVIRESLQVLDGFATRVLEVDGEGPALVLLHGFSDSADTWRPLLERLGRSRRRAVAIGEVDPPATGDGAPLAGEEVLIDGNDNARALIEGVTIRRCIDKSAGHAATASALRALTTHG